MALLGTSRDTGFDIKALAQINDVLEKEVLPKYKHLLDDSKVSIIDINVLLHQTPGGMLSNLVNQLREMDALDRIDEVYAELPRVRKDLGQIPLVTPTSQIVGIQTVNNVLFDDANERYKMITGQVKDLCYGLYGKTAVPINPEVQKKALKGYPRGETPISVRPAEILEPELEKAKADLKDLTTDMEDIILYALYPVTGKKFLMYKYGKEVPPDELKPRTLEQVKAEAELIAKAKAGKLVEVKEKPAPEKSPHARNFYVFVENEYFEVCVDEPGGPPVIPYAPTSAARPGLAASAPGRSVPPRPTPPSPPPKASAPAALTPKAPQPKSAKPAGPAAKAPEIAGGTPVKAPMPGMIVSIVKQVGESVKAGETVVVLEAMKMENALTASVSGTIRSIHCKVGESVAKNAVLVVIE
jgi:oxaloacetate decarboxylase alpha subunit/pyruvate carboxylase subunit B